MLEGDRIEPIRSELVAAVNGWQRPRILVFGDVILDRYSWGQVQRISPEAPIPVLRYEREEHRLGGAAAVAGLLSGLGAEVVCAGVIGADAGGDVLRGLFHRAHVTWIGVEAEDGRSTTTKQRFLSSRHGHTQLLRVDYESDIPVSLSVDTALEEAWMGQLSQCDAVIISDYAKGTCRPESLQRLIHAAVSIGIPVLVDPARRGDFLPYVGATAIVPNRQETELVTKTTIAMREDALNLGSEFCQRWGVQAAVVKLDHEGIVLLRDQDAGQHFPISSNPVFDVTGAGDTVIAVLAMCLATGQSWETGCQLANVAGGIQVQRVGVARITRTDLLNTLNLETTAGPSRIVNLDEAARRSTAARERRKTVVFTNGCFAALHAGHLAYLQEARSLGDLLIVACNSSTSIRRLKGDRPIIPDAERLQMLAALPYVDAVLLFEEDTPHRLLETIRPDVLVKGGTTEFIVGREIVESYGGRVIRLSSVPGVSTTQLLAAGVHAVN